jgi:hypothetical protein
MVRHMLPVIVLLACCVAIAQPPAQARKPVAPIATWTGHILNMELMPRAADVGVFTAPAELKTLWSAWRPDEVLPGIDFAKDFVLVMVGHGPNKIGWRITLDHDGNLEPTAMMTQMAGPGFCYSIVQVSREGVKSVSGKPLAPPATAPATAPAR